MYSAKLLKENKIKFIPNQVHEDYYFNLEVFSKTTKIVGIDSSLYFYYVDHGRQSMSKRLHAGIDLLKWRNEYFTNNFPEISIRSRRYAYEVYKWFIAHRKNILNSQLEEDDKVKRIKEMDNSELYKWVLSKTGYSKKKIVREVDRQLKIIRLKEKIKGLISKANGKS